MQSLSSLLDRFQPAARLVLRVVLGGIFLWHGLQKFDNGIGGVEGMFEMWDVPLPDLTAPLTAGVEVVAGAALIAGIATRIAATALSVVMVGALVFVKVDLGLISSGPMSGAELDLALLAGLFAVIAFGPGALSVDGKLGFERTAPRPRQAALTH